MSLASKYRNNVHSTTGVTPAELLISRKPCTHVDLLHPDLSKRVEDKQTVQKEVHDRNCHESSLKESDPMYARNFQSGDKWLVGRISKVLGTRTYLVHLDIGKTVKRHVNQLKYRKVVEQPPPDEVWYPMPVQDRNVQVSQPPNRDANSNSDASPNSDAQPVRTSTRTSSPPDRYNSTRSLRGRRCSDSVLVCTGVLVYCLCIYSRWLMMQYCDYVLVVLCS